MCNITFSKVNGLPRLWVSDHQQGWRPVENTTQRVPQIFWIEGRKALIKNNEIGLLQQRPGDVETAPLTVRKLPACLADHLQHLSWHPVEQISEAELAANGVSLSHIVRLWRPAPAHQQIEGEGAGEDMVLMELRRSYYPPPPALGPERLSVQTPEEQKAGLRMT